MYILFFFSKFFYRFLNCTFSIYIFFTFYTDFVGLIVFVIFYLASFPFM